MDDASLDGLEAAVRVTPDNVALVKVVLRACVSTEKWARGLSLVRTLPVATTNADRVRALHTHP